MKRFLHIFVILLFCSANSNASKIDEIKKINEMFVNGYIDENECADLKYRYGKNIFLIALTLVKI